MINGFTQNGYRALTVERLTSGRRHSPRAAAMPRLTETTLVNGTLAVIGRRLASGDTGNLAELEPQLAQLLLIPYVGRAEAARLAGS